VAVSSSGSIREQLHPQLAQLWKLEPLHSASGELLTPESNMSVLTSRGGQCFAYIVGDTTGLRAELDILLLRPRHPRTPIVVGGDIDNRIKTLLDGLRCPASDQEVDPTGRPSSPNDPTFVLLQDDRLVSRLNIETDRWLADDRSPDDVRLVIRVTTKAERTIFLNALW
jgi:hypothetical protein